MSEVYLALTVAAAAVPALIYLVIIWLFDRYEREPLLTVIGVFAYGATAGVFLSLLASGFLLVLLTPILESHMPVETLSAVIVAPLAEEPGKASVLLILLLGREFDNTTDGLVYGAAAGLGFAMTENFFYFLDPYQAGDVDRWAQMIMIRASFSALLHCSASALFGAMLGRFRFHGFFKQWVVAPILGYLFAASLHAFFNGMLVYSSFAGEESFSFFSFGAVILVGVVLTIITQLALMTEHRMMKKELMEEANNGVLPAEHASIIPYWSKRRRKNWLPKHVDRDSYIETATELAFRRHQARLKKLPDNSQNSEIHRLRLKLNQILGKA